MKRHVVFLFTIVILLFSSVFIFFPIIKQKLHLNINLFASDDETYTLKDYFNVSNPLQIVKFATASANLDPAQTYIVDDDSIEVPSQVLSTNQVTVETDLPANATKNFTVKTDHGPGVFSNPVTLTTHDHYYEITNGLTGVRIYRQNGETRTIALASVTVTNNVARFITTAPNNLETATSYLGTSTANLSVTVSGLSSCTYLNGQTLPIDMFSYLNPTTFQATVSGANCTSSDGSVTVPETRKAPIQGIQYKDGTWTGTGPNYISQPTNNQGLILNAKTISTNIIDNGPLDVIVEVAYTYNRPPYNVGPVDIPGGSGYYTSRIELQKDQPSILMKDDTDMDLDWFVNANPDLDANEARYRGHVTSNVAYGHQENGDPLPTSGGGTSPQQDAFYNLDFSKDFAISYVTGDGLIKHIGAWDPFAADTGWYWQIYNKDASSSANLLGIYAGEPSYAITTQGSGPGIYTRVADPNTGQNGTGFEFMVNRRAANNSYGTRVRMAWGIFVSTKADLIDPLEVQPIGKQWNLHGGINLTKLSQYTLTYTDPPQGFGGLFMDKSIVQAIITKLRADNSGPFGGGFWQHLYDIEPNARDMVAMWHDITGTETTNQFNIIASQAHTILDSYINGNGIFTRGISYYEGAQTMSGYGVLMDQVLANEYISPTQKDKIKAVAALYGNLVWDNDFVPLDNYQGFNFGTENQPLQMVSFRDFFAMMLANHPAMVTRVAGVENRTVAILEGIVNDFGAEIGSTNYMFASFVPVLHNLMQLQQISKAAHTTDPFTVYDKLSTFGEFSLQFQSPPDGRYGGVRKIVSIGDGYVDSTESWAELATALKDINPTFAGRLISAWVNGSEHETNTPGGTSIVMIDEDIPQVDDNLKSATFPGWMTVLRYGWNTENESALWFVNGNFYRDHRHFDYGEVAAYALKNPIMLDWGSFYTPDANGTYYHSMVTPESDLSQAWDADNPPLNMLSSPIWKNEVQDQFTRFGDSDFAKATFTSSDDTINWDRSVYTLHANVDYPVIVIKDNYSGSGATDSKISTLNLMAEGAVTTPSGLVTPTVRTATQSETPSAYASASAPFSLTSGLNRFSFTGQWDIDWDLYTLSPNSQEALIGNWGNVSTSTTSRDQFQAATGISYQEHQHILRVKGTSDNTFIILPYRKGEARSSQTVQEIGSQTVITNGDEVNTFNEHFSAFKNLSKTVLTTYDDTLSSYQSFAIAGGPTELKVENNEATIIAHGDTGIRTLTIPGDWADTNQMSRNGSVYTFDYEGSDPETITLSIAQHNNSNSNSSSNSSSSSNNSSPSNSASIQFPLAITNISGLGNPFLSTYNLANVKKSYTTISTSPTFSGIVWAGSLVTLKLTDQNCKFNCTKTYNTIGTGASKFLISIPPGHLVSGHKYTVLASVGLNGLSNKLPEFTLNISSASWFSYVVNQFFQTFIKSLNIR